MYAGNHFVKCRKAFNEEEALRTLVGLTRATFVDANAKQTTPHNKDKFLVKTKKTYQVIQVN